MFSRSSPTKSAAAPARPAQRAPAAAPAKAAPQQSSGGGMMSGLMGTMAQGMAFGAGSEVAHQAVRSMTGGSSSHGSE